jgi:hypothetical protein
MKADLDAWLERVMYARDPLFNQAAERTKDVLLAGPPSVPIATTGQSLDGGKIEILGIGTADGQKLVPGARVDVHVYFKVVDRSAIAYKFLLAAWPVYAGKWKPTDPAPPNLFKSAMRPTADGFFASDRWRAGEYVRERFSVTVPLDWAGDSLAIGLVATDNDGHKADATGQTPSNDPNLLVLGVLPLQRQQP